MKPPNLFLNLLVPSTSTASCSNQIRKLTTCLNLFLSLQTYITAFHVFTFILTQVGILTNEGRVACILKSYTLTGKRENKPRELPLARYHFDGSTFLFNHHLTYLCIFFEGKNYHNFLFIEP